MIGYFQPPKFRVPPNNGLQATHRERRAPEAGR
jgi:hypothetical protein